MKLVSDKTIQTRDTYTFRRCFVFCILLCNLVAEIRTKHS